MIPVGEPFATTAATPEYFRRYAWGVLGWNFLIVLWGAYVRASGSGAGCGDQWPLCKGAVVPQVSHLDTIVEFAHRATSGVGLFAVIALAVWSMYRFPRGHRVRLAAGLSVVFIVLEVLLGAGIVLFRYVAQNASIGRAFYLSLHLVNTQLLLAALALTAWFSREPTERGAARPGKRRPLVMATLPAVLLVSISGVVAALGDTLFPVSSLAEGMRQDVSATAHFLIRLRILHPALAILAAAFCIFVAVRVLRSVRSPLAARIAMVMMFVTMAQMIAGAMNIALLAPIWMQITHLFLADLVWLSLVILTVET